MPPQTSRSGPTPRGSNLSLGGHSVSSPCRDEVLPEDGGRYRHSQRMAWTGLEEVFYSGLLPQQQVNNMPTRSGPQPPAPPSHASHMKSAQRDYDICRQYTPQGRADSVTAPFGPDYQPRAPQFYVPPLQNAQRGNVTSQQYTAQQPVSPTTRPMPSRPQLDTHPHGSGSRAGQSFAVPPQTYLSRRSHDEQKRSRTTVNPAERLGFDSAQLRALANFERRMSSPEAVTTVRAMKDLGCSSGLAREVAKFVEAGVPYDTAVAHVRSITQHRIQPAVNRHRPRQAFVADDEDGGDSENSDDDEEDDEEEDDDDEEDDEEEEDEEEDEEEEDEEEDVDHSQEAEIVSRKQEEVQAPAAVDLQPGASSDMDKTDGDQCKDDNEVDGDGSAESASEGNAINNADDTDAAREDDEPVHDEASDVEEGTEGRESGSESKEAESGSEESDEAANDENDGGAQEDEVTIVRGRDEEDHVADDEASMINAMGRLDLDVSSSSEPQVIAPPETEDEADKPTFQSAGVTEDSGASWHDGRPSRTLQDIIEHCTHDAYSAPPTNNQALQPYNPPLDAVAEVSEMGPLGSFNDFVFPTDYLSMPGWPHMSDSASVGYESNADNTQRAMTQSLIINGDRITANEPPYLAASSVLPRPQSTYRSDLQSWPEAVEIEEQLQTEASGKRSPFQVSVDALGTESSTRVPCSEESNRSFHSCFVPGCSVTRQHISILLRHCESQHSFFYCKICCMADVSKQDEGAHLPKCRLSCISSDCTSVKSIQGTDDRRKYRHEKTSDCPTAARGTVETQHRLDYLKHLFLSVFPTGSSHGSLTKPNTIRRQRETKSTDGKITKRYRCHATPIERHKAERPLLLKIVRYYMDRKGLDSDILKLLQSDAPELLKELVQKPVNDGVSEMRGSTTQPGTAINGLPGRITSTVLVETGNQPRTTRNTEVATTQKNYDMRSQVQESTVQHDIRAAENLIDPFDSKNMLYNYTCTPWNNCDTAAPCASVPVHSTETLDFVPLPSSGQTTAWRQHQPSATSSQRSGIHPDWSSMLSMSQRQPDAVLDYANARRIDSPKLSGSALDHFKQLNERYGPPSSIPDTQECSGAIHHATQADHTRYLTQAPSFTHDGSRSTGDIDAGLDMSQQSLAYDAVVPLGYSGRVGLRGHSPAPDYSNIPGLGFLPIYSERDVSQNQADEAQVS